MHTSHHMAKNKQQHFVVWTSVARHPWPSNEDNLNLMNKVHLIVLYRHIINIFLVCKSKCLIYTECFSQMFRLMEMRCFSVNSSHQLFSEEGVPKCDCVGTWYFKAVLIYVLVSCTAAYSHLCVPQISAGPLVSCYRVYRSDRATHQS